HQDHRRALVDVSARSALRGDERAFRDLLRLSHQHDTDRARLRRKAVNTTELQNRVEELLAENHRLRDDLETRARITARALASYQQRVLQLEIIRQQNEDLDALAADLAQARRVEEV